MQNTKQSKHDMYQEDEIDLRELFRTIVKNKKLIILITTIVTLLAGAYAFMKTPIYEASALVEIGNYKTNNNNKILLNEPSELIQKLNIIFIEVFKNEINKEAEITSISIPKKAKSFIEIKAEATSNKLAISQINALVSHIQNKDKQILDDVKKRRESKINNIDEQIKNIKTKEIAIIEKKIIIYTEKLKSYQKQIKQLDKSIAKVQTKNSALTALLIMQRRDLTDSILTINMHILDLENSKEKLTSTTINRLKEQRDVLASLLLPYNYKNSQIVGKILTEDYTSKPKKKLIIVVAFITGLILSIFLVFFLEFIRDFKEEEIEI